MGEIERVHHTDYKKLIKLFEEDVNCYDAKDSEVSKFFAGRNIFITGGTGFLGKLTIEKLLRISPDISGIFMLVRSKKGKDVHTRIDEIFNDDVFERLGKKYPKFRHKIIPVSGDVGLPGLGLRIEDRKVITEKVSVIFHVAATVRFDEKINNAYAINVRGTEEAIALGKECKNLASFLHVSTAYSHCVHKEIGEIFYDVPLSPEKLGQLCNSVPQEILHKITPELIGDFPNTYAYTKAIAEDVVRRQGKPLPICVFRPSIVISTYKEPLKGWIDNIYGPTGIFLGTGLGLLRVLMANKDCLADMVPADMVVNGMIAAAFKNAQKKEENIPIYNYVSTVQRPITWGDYDSTAGKYGLNFGPVKSIWYCSLTLMQNKYAYLIYAFLVHTFPAMLVDSVAVMIGRQPQLLKVYKKIHNFNNVIAYFATRKWTFHNDNVQNLYKGLSEVDKRIFMFDMNQLDWDHYFHVYGLGVRVFVAKDPVSTIEEGRKRFARMKLLHYTVVTILALLGIRMLIYLLTFMFNVVF